jgi:hypothetical protein
MLEEKKGFLIYKDWCLTILDLMKDNEDPLTHSELGMLMEAVFSYQSLGEDLSKNLPKHIRFLFKNIVDVFNRDLDKWEVTREKRRNSGKKGGLAKASNSSKCYDLPKTESEPVAIAKVAKPAKVEKEPCLFDEFYDLYPKKQGKQSAIKAYEKALKKNTHEVIIEGVRNYKAQIASKNTEMQYVKQPATWLNAGCWDDDYGSTTSTTPSTNAYDALFTKIKSVMDQDGNFEHNEAPCNIHNIEKFISADENGIKVYYTDARGYTNPKYFTIEAITIGAYC